MQSGAPATAIPEDDEWDDGEDWEEDYDDSSSSSFLDMDLDTKLKMAGVLGVVLLVVMSSMIFTNFGFYSGAGTVSVLIDVEEALNPEDRTLGAYILATSPSFGMLTKEGDFTISVNGNQVYSGKFDLNDEGRGSISLDYEDFFTINGEYVLEVNIKGTTDSDSVDLYKSASSVRGEVPVFDGNYPLSKSENLLINLQFKAGETTSYISPWVQGTIKIYHADEIFDDDQGESYWDDDGSRNFQVVETITFTVAGTSINWEYQSGTTDNGVSLWLDTSEFYSDGGSGDYAVTIEFTNDLGEDNSIKEGQTFWKWFHICQTEADGSCDGNK